MQKQDRTGSKTKITSKTETKSDKHRTKIKNRLETKIS